MPQASHERLRQNLAQLQQLTFGIYSPADRRFLHTALLETIVDLRLFSTNPAFAQHRDSLQQRIQLLDQHRDRLTQAGSAPTSPTGYSTFHALLQTTIVAALIDRRLVLVG